MTQRRKGNTCVDRDGLRFTAVTFTERCCEPTCDFLLKMVEGMLRDTRHRRAIEYLTIQPLESMVAGLKEKAGAGGRA
jgi:hypothetical protein